MDRRDKYEDWIIMKIHFTNEAFLKLKYFVGLATGEVSGFGRTEVTGESIFVKDIIVLEQQVSSGSTIIEENAVNDFLHDLIERDEDPAEWNIWWHSHGNMSAFWSLTDDATIEEMNMPWVLSIVASKGSGVISDEVGEITLLCRVDIFEPSRLTFDKLPWLYSSENDAILEWCDAEMREKVKEVRFQFGWKKKKKSSKGKKASSYPKRSSNQSPSLGPGESDLGPPYTLVKSAAEPLPSLMATKSRNTIYLPNSTRKKT